MIHHRLISGWSVHDALTIIPGSFESTHMNRPTGINHHATKGIIQKTPSGEIVAIYTSVSDAAAAVNGTTSNISRVAKGRRKYYKGFTWEYSG